MADAKSVWYSKLSGEATITALVGLRIYPNVIPQDATLPAIAYQTISRAGVMAHDGATGLAWQRIQTTIVADSSTGAEAVAEACRKVLDGFRGTVGSVPVHAVFLDSAADNFGEITDTYVKRQDYRMMLTEEL